MSFSISSLLTRNLHDVFGENDPVRRRAAIDEIFTDDCVFYEPRGIYRVRDEIDHIAGVIKATHPDFRYQPIAEPEELGNGGRIQWVSGRPGEANTRTTVGHGPGVGRGRRVRAEETFRGYANPAPSRRSLLYTS
jgi:hypothetical protein